MSEEQLVPPSVFYKIGYTNPVKMTFLCQCPYSSNAYAIYFNEQSKVPERVYLLSIAEYQTDINKVYLIMYENAKLDLQIISGKLKEMGIAFDGEAERHKSNKIMNKTDQHLFEMQEAEKIIKAFDGKEIPEYADFDESKVEGLSDQHSGTTLNGSIKIAKFVQETRG